LTADVDKQWAIMQQKAAERKRLRSLTEAHKASTTATKDMEKRVEVLEAFALQWQLLFEKWQKKLMEFKENDFPNVMNITNDREEKDLPLQEIVSELTETGLNQRVLIDRKLTEN